MGVALLRPGGALYAQPPAASPALLFAMSLNSRLSALRTLRTCVLHLEAGEPRGPRSHLATTSAVVVFCAALGLAGLGTLVGALALNLSPTWELMLSAAAGAALLAFALSCLVQWVSTLPHNWDDLLRQTLLGFEYSTPAVRAEAQALAAETPLDLEGVKLWLSKEMALTPP